MGRAREASGRRGERRGGIHEPTAEREGIVDQQDAALEAIEEVQSGDDEDPRAGPAPTG